MSDARPHLEMLARSVEADIMPLLHVPDGAPFAIIREVLSYIDYLGYLYTGKRAVSARSRAYMVDVLSRVDWHYGGRASELYEMYRCSCVHQFTPKTFKNRRGQTLKWLVYRGARSCQLPIEGRAASVTHLELIPAPGAGQYWLPVSTPCLVDDLLASIANFCAAEPEAVRVAAWNRATWELEAPVHFESGTS